MAYTDDTAVIKKQVILEKTIRSINREAKVSRNLFPIGGRRWRRLTRRPHLTAVTVFLTKLAIEGKIYTQIQVSLIKIMEKFFLGCSESYVCVFNTFGFLQNYLKNTFVTRDI